MICQRSGRCCFSMDVVIRIGDRAKLKPGGVLCPHLTFDGVMASCAVHQEPWFKETPCHVYGNPDIDPDYYHTRNRPCRMGEAIQQNGGLFKVFPNDEHKTIKAEELEDLGPWSGG